MALIEYDTYRQKLRELKPELDKLSVALDLDGARQESERLTAETEQDGFWNDLARSRKVQTRLKQLQNKISRQEKLLSAWEDLTALCDMGQEADDAELLEELKADFAALETQAEESRMSTLLSGEYDGNNTILQFHAGAGGTEAQDWAQMLYRMYTRWAERHGFTYKTLNYEDGDEAGIKSAAISIEGENAYGLLKSENGIHRLVRISPFDAIILRSRRWRSCPKWKRTIPSKSATRISKCRSTGPPARADSTSTRLPPPCASSTSLPESSWRRNRKEVSFRTKTTV